MNFDCIIIGGGAAGLTASIYTNRAGLKSVVMEKMFLGGQTAITNEIDNYPGFSGISGSELMDNISNHAKKHGLSVINEEVLEIDSSKKPFVVKTNSKEYTAKTIIITTGAKPRMLGVDGEKEFTGRGVSYCATCDGAFYRGKEVAVLGSGNTAIEDAIFLARICKKVYLISRSDYFKGEKKIFENLKNLENIELIYNHTAKEINGENFVYSISLTNTKDNTIKKIDVSGIFVAVGVIPHSNILKNEVNTDSQGYIKTDETMMTSIPGIFAAGDARTTPLRQVITAASDGAISAFYASLFIAQNY